MKVTIAKCQVVAGLIAVACVSGCRSDSDSTSTDFSSRTKPACGSRSSSEYFFPQGLSFTLDRERTATRDAYAHYLNQMNEPSLSCGASPIRAFRLVMIHAVDPRPIAIRVGEHAGRRVLNATTLSGGIAGAPLTVSGRWGAGMSEQQWSELFTAIERFNFWLTPTIGWYSRRVDKRFIDNRVGATGWPKVSRDSERSTSDG